MNYDALMDYVERRVIELIREISPLDGGGGHDGWLRIYEAMMSPRVRIEERGRH